MSFRFAKSLDFTAGLSLIRCQSNVFQLAYLPVGNGIVAAQLLQARCCSEQQV